MPRLKKRSDGRYCRTTVDEKTGKRIYIYGASEREVNRKLADLREKAHDPTAFSKIADAWWKEAQNRISPTSVRGYRIAYERAKEFFYDTPISDITANDIYRYLSDLARLNYSKSTVINHKIVVNRILHYAIIEGYIIINPARDAEIPRGLKQKKRTAASPEDEERIRESASVWLAPYLALMTGMRKGELLALQWRDVDFEKNLISVNKSLYYANAPTLKSTKTEAGTRKIPILAPLRVILEERREKDDNYVISDDGKKPLSAKRFRTLLKHYQERTGITSTFHQLRKSFATAAARYGVPPKVLQAILGHKDIATTMNVYAEVRDDALQSAADTLNNTAYVHASQDPYTPPKNEG